MEGGNNNESRSSEMSGKSEAGSSGVGLVCQDEATPKQVQSSENRPSSISISISAHPYCLVWSSAQRTAPVALALALPLTA